VTLICTAPGHAAVERSATPLRLLYEARGMPPRSEDARDSRELRLLGIDDGKRSTVVCTGLNNGHLSAAKGIHYSSAFPIGSTDCLALNMRVESIHRSRLNA
jgi:hypothetical protein